jgi:hypothetical protein
MALTSPGVQVTVIDESFYTPAEPGTTPLIVVATGQDKSNAAGTGTASATTQANAGKAFRLTSQKDLVDLFGVPFFEKTASGSPIHGGERNEYGLLAAYSFLGVSNNAFVVRADVNLDQLAGSTEEPGAAPADGTWWVDTTATTWGIQEWNSASRDAGGQKFTAKTPLVLTDADSLNISANEPRSSIGSIGDYAVVFETGSDAKENAKVYYKSAGNGDTVEPGTWVLVGSNNWSASHAAVKGTVAVTSTNFPSGFTGSYAINNTVIPSQTFASLSALANVINSNVPGVSANVVNNRLYLYTDGTTAADGNSGDSTAADAALYLENVSGTEWSSLGITPGFYYGPKLQQSPHTSVPTFKRSDLTESVEGAATGSVWIKTTEPNSGARWRVKQYNAATAAWVQIDAPLYATTSSALYYLDRAGGGVNLAVDSVFVQYNATETSGFDASPETAQFRVWRRKSAGGTVVTSDVLGSTGTTFTAGTNNYSFTIKQSVPGTLALVDATATVTFNGATDGAEVARNIATAINAASFGFDSSNNEIANYITATVTSDNRVKITHTAGGDIRLTNVTNTPLSKMFNSGAYNPHTNTDGIANLYAAPEGATETFIASNWSPLSSEAFEASGDNPVDAPADNQLWYNPAFGDVDMLAHNGTTWDGYLNVYPNTDPSGPQVAATAPETQSDGSALVDNDLWISTADLENFPTMYRWSEDALAWQLVDKTDQTTEDGVLFADARYGSSGATGDQAALISTLLTSDYLDPDAPDPDLYPRGMLLWNLRRSGGNVKRYVSNYIDTTADNPRFGAAPGESMADYAVARWVTASANNEDGSGSFGRKAQRKVVVSAVKSVIDTSSEIRDEERRNFNIIAAPGYPEALSNLINLNIDRGLTAFVIGDTPLRLPSDATSLVNWGTNAELVTDNGDEGIVSYDEYAAVYYPNGFTTDLGGSNAVVPASHMMLRTIALSDQVSYPWFAPAGTRRGGITNATSVGYIDAATGEFQTVALNEGTRDVLYDLKVNPIPFFVGVGLVAFGQKTRARNASALDRVNVARLTVYLRSQLAKLARPYLFEPNDKITRDEIKGAVESLLLELVGLRAIYDFAVVCDETNNTPSRVDRNELYVDIAIEPVKSIEFIYIPLRIKNTGEI